MSCFQVSEKVFQVENNLSLDQIDYKLTKLKEALEIHAHPKSNNCNNIEKLH